MRGARGDRLLSEGLEVELCCVGKIEANEEIPMKSVITEHIEITPGVCGGKPRIAGHRIKVQDIVIWHEQLDWSPDEIVSQYTTITLADVYAALAYYHDHLSEIRQQIQADEELIKAMQAQTSLLVQQKLAERNIRHDSLPPR
jgi:uncharacterized protein (DUF433 family)